MKRIHKLLGQPFKGARMSPSTQSADLSSLLPSDLGNRFDEAIQWTDGPPEWRDAAKEEIKRLMLELIGPDEEVTYKGVVNMSGPHPRMSEVSGRNVLRAKLRREVAEL